MTVGNKCWDLPGQCAAHYQEGRGVAVSECYCQRFGVVLGMEC